TYGSPIYRHHLPDQDGLIVERLRAAGAITIGKTNTPEFGAGSQTYNEVFGETLNPYDLTKTCGGSSGGAAVALACRMLPLVDGRVTAVIDAQRKTFESLGCRVEDGEPDFTDADEIFQVWRAWRFELKVRDLLRTHRAQLKETIIWNAEEGAKLTGPQVARAE